MHQPSPQSLSSDIHLLGDLLGKVIRRQSGVDVYDLEERFRALSKVRRSDQDAAAEVTAKINALVDSLSPDDLQAVLLHQSKDSLESHAGQRLPNEQQHE